MDINKLFRAGKRECGRVLNILPKDEIGSPMDYMMEILKEETLPSLDIVYPRLYRTTFGINHLVQINDQTELTSRGLGYCIYKILRTIYGTRHWKFWGYLPERKLWSMAMEWWGKLWAI